MCFFAVTSLILLLQFLAVHSPVFKAIFFGNFVEKGKEEVELKDVVYEVRFT